MSDSNSGLLLHLALDAIENGKVLDGSGNAYHSTVTGAPQVVSDDKLGGTLRFDGAHDAVTLPAAAVPTGAQITIAFWAYGGNALPTGHSLLEGQNAQNERILNLVLGNNNGKVTFVCGRSGGSADRLSVDGDAQDYRGRWTHWGFTKDAQAGRMAIYKDGVLWQQATNLQAPLAPLTKVTLASGIDGTGYYPGRLAHLRIYARALDAAEIGALIAADQLQAPPPNYAYPVDFGLYDEHYQPLLLIDEKQANQTLQLTLRNTAGQSLRFADLDNNTPTADNHHLRLRFRPSTLSATALDKVELNTNPWRMSQPTLDNNGVVSFYLLNRGNDQRRTLDADEELILELKKLSAAALGGARTTRVELSYQNLTAVGAATPLQDDRLHTLRILHTASPAAQQHLPVRAGFLGGNRVRNDGATVNTLHLRLVNTGQQPIPFNGPESDAPTRLLLRFDVGQTPAEDWWALATASQVASMNVQADGWTVRNEFEGIIPFWSLTPAAGLTALAPGAQIMITLSNLVTNFVAGETQARLTYENLPGYGDGELTVALAKSSLQLREPWRAPDAQGPRAEVNVAGVLNPTTYAFSMQTQNHVQIQRDSNTPVAFEVIVHDPHHVFQQAPNNHHFLAPVAGLYLFTATLEFSMPGEYYESELFAKFEWGIYRNRQPDGVYASGSAVGRDWTQAKIPPITGTLTTLMQLAVGDQVTVHVAPPPAGTLPFLVSGKLHGLLVSGVVA